METVITDDEAIIKTLGEETEVNTVGSEQMLLEIAHMQKKIERFTQPVAFCNPSFMYKSTENRILKKREKPKLKKNGLSGLFHHVTLKKLLNVNFMLVFSFTVILGYFWCN